MSFSERAGRRDAVTGGLLLGTGVLRPRRAAILFPTASQHISHGYRATVVGPAFRLGVGILEDAGDLVDGGGRTHGGSRQRLCTGHGP